jgi:hypothetical protein
MSRFSNVVFSGLFAAIAAERRDTEVTTLLWQLSTDPKKSEQLHKLLVENPEYLKLRSGDGRGALWWAFESGNSDAVAFMQAVDEKAVTALLKEKDDKGSTPAELCKDKEKCSPTAEQLEKGKAEVKKINEQVDQEFKDLEADWVADDEF